MTAGEAARFVLRRAVDADAAALTCMVIRAKASHGYDRAFLDACRDELRITPESIARLNMIVAHAGPAQIGCAGFSDAGEVGVFFVEPVWHRAGVGRALWHRLREDALRSGHVRLHLDADPNALPFYRALGFRVIGKSRSGSIPERMLPLMACNLERAATSH